MAYKVTIDFEFFEPEDFNGARSNPRRAVCEWMRDVVSVDAAQSLLDSWGAGVEERSKSNRLVCMVRLARSSLAAMVKNRGKKGFCLGPYGYA